MPRECVKVFLVLPCILSCAFNPPKNAGEDSEVFGGQLWADTTELSSRGVTGTRSTPEACCSVVSRQALTLQGVRGQTPRK